jgi:glycosyltransferase involved in cell wall biosynthesis
VSWAGHRRLRVVLVADSLDVGGAERHLVGLGAGLAQAGHDVTIATSTGGSLVRIAEESGLTVRPLLSMLVKRRFSPAFAWQLARLLSRERVDLVHAHMYASAIASTVACLATATPLLVTEHSEASWRGRAARHLNRLAYARARRLIAVSRGIAERLTIIDRVDPERITVIPNAAPRFGDGTQHAPHACRIRTVDDEAVVGVVARLQPEKGVDDFLRAAEVVGAKLPHVRFVVVGDGPAGAELTALAHDLGLNTRVHFLGFRTDAPEIVRDLDVLVVPSRSEGTPLVVLEAMSAGVPIVANRVGGIPEQIRDRLEGILVPPERPELLARGVLTLLQDPLLAHKLGQAGQARARTAFDHASMVRTTLGVYREVLDMSAQSNWRITHPARL